MWMAGSVVIWSNGGYGVASWTDRSSVCAGALSWFFGTGSVPRRTEVSGLRILGVGGHYFFVVIGGFAVDEAV
jgi:hypothetical protein